jgi:hypothetical protein
MREERRREGMEKGSGEKQREKRKGRKERDSDVLNNQNTLMTRAMKKKHLHP